MIEELPKIYLTIGLGNPGNRYSRTRHNVGRTFVDWVNDLKEVPLESSLFFLTKSSGVFMNESGKFVAKTLKKKGLPSERLILIHDDLDLGLGEFKIQRGRGDAGHKGVQSVVESLGTKDFWRVRLGIGRPVGGKNVDDYVLEPFSREELAVVENSWPEVIQKMKSLLSP